MNETAEYILEHSELLIKSDCVIIDNVLYELCRADNKLYTETVVRFFKSCDDYDYVTDQTILDKVNKHFNSNAVLSK